MLIILTSEVVASGWGLEDLGMTKGGASSPPTPTSGEREGLETELVTNGQQLSQSHHETTMKPLNLQVGAHRGVDPERAEMLCDPGSSLPFDYS